MAKQYRIIAVSDSGMRKVNQDSVGVFRQICDNEEAVLAVVCDGLGGLENGEFASAQVVRACGEWFQYEFSQIVFQTLNDPQESGQLESVLAERLTRILQRENDLIYRYASSKGIQMGTTATVMIWYKQTYYIIQVGDSRAYEVDQGIRQLTEDQSLVQQEVRQGRLTSEEAKCDKRRNVLLQSVGTSECLRPVFQYGKIPDRAGYFLCSDGFVHEMEEKRITALFEACEASDAEIEKKVHDIITQLQQKGEKDNISVVLVMDWQV